MSLTEARANSGGDFPSEPSIRNELYRCGGHSTKAELCLSRLARLKTREISRYDIVDKNCRVDRFDE